MDVGTVAELVNSTDQRSLCNIPHYLVLNLCADCIDERSTVQNEVRTLVEWRYFCRQWFSDAKCIVHFCYDTIRRAQMPFSFFPVACRQHPLEDRCQGCSAS